MQPSEQKEVYFDLYCDMCEHRDKKDTDEPCDDCLAEPVNLNSHKPVKFKEKK